ncbi:MAG: hypothetical protein HQ517_11460, partial [SAR324 cluster bacterium]|nr:hypothetical protein [SAR324 cluster bacterium]
VNTVATADIAPSGEFYFSFTPTETAKYLVKFTGASNDYQISLRNSTGFSIPNVENWFTSGNKTYSTQGDLTANSVYTLYLRNWNDSSSDSYTVKIIKQQNDGVDTDGITLGTPVVLTVGTAKTGSVMSRNSDSNNASYYTFTTGTTASKYQVTFLDNSDQWLDFQIGTDSTFVNFVEWLNCGGGTEPCVSGKTWNQLDANTTYYLKVTAWEALYYDITINAVE